jgi:hypothetical protein
MAPTLLLAVGGRVNGGLYGTDSTILGGNFRKSGMDFV